MAAGPFVLHLSDDIPEDLYVPTPKSFLSGPFYASISGQPREEYGEAVEVMGEGTFGRVERVVRDDIEYVIKMIKPRDYEGDTYQNILNEVAFQLNLVHPNIASVTDVILEGTDTAHIVMPLAAMDLKKLIWHGHFKNREDRRQEAAAQLVSAVAYLATHNILHRDIKPENVLCFRSSHFGEGNYEYRYKLADFGIARPSECQRVNDDFWAYTLPYRAPEVLEQIDPYNEKADVWALGCTLYELVGHGLAFYAPRSDNRVVDTLTLINRTFGNATPPRFLVWDDTSAQFEYLIRSMITINPVNRPRIFDVQSYHYFHEFSMDRFKPLTCTERTLLNPMTLTPGNLSSYESYVLETALNWISDVIFAVCDGSFLDFDLYGECLRDVMRTDWLAKIMFLTYVSHFPTSNSKLQLVAAASMFNAINFYSPCNRVVDTHNLAKYGAGFLDPTELSEKSCQLAVTLQFNLLGSTPFDILNAQLNSVLVPPALIPLAQNLLLIASFIPYYAVKSDIAEICVMEAQGLLEGSAHDHFRKSVLAKQKELGVQLKPRVSWTNYVAR